MNQAYRSIGWQSVVLIAAMIPMSSALALTGGAELIARYMVDTIGALGPLALLAGAAVLALACNLLDRRPTEPGKPRRSVLISQQLNRKDS